MNTQAQKRAIVDKLLGASPATLPSPAALDEPWRTIYRRVSRAKNHVDAFSLIWNAAKSLPDREPLTHELIDLLPPEDAFTPFPSLQEMSAQFEPVDWLWPSWIPRGMLTLFGAAPGMGKSLVALDLARRIIHDNPFPDGAPVPCPGSNVLIVDAEGAPALLNQRAQAWDIDCRRLFLMLAPGHGDLVDLAQPEQQLLLLQMIRDIRPALVVVDSLAGATAHGETSLQGARAILGFLAAIASKANLALLVIHHLRKRTRSGRAASAPRVVADDLRGSSHISAAARSVLALSQLYPPPAFPLLPEADPPTPQTVQAPPQAGQASLASAPLHQSHRDGLRLLEVVKANLCRQPPPLGLLFEGENLPVPILRYAPLDQDLVAAWSEPPSQPRQVDLCAHWLLQFLTTAGVPVKPADVVRAAAQEGFPRTTLYRARRALAGEVVDLGNSPRDPGKHWTLVAVLSPPSPPSQQAPHPQQGTYRDSDTVEQ